MKKTSKGKRDQDWTALEKLEVVIKAAISEDELGATVVVEVFTRAVRGVAAAGAQWPRRIGEEP